MSAQPPPRAPSHLFGLQLSRLNQRRLVNFRTNRRGYWSFWIFWMPVSYTHLTLPTILLV